jgi:hypothetical protein
VSVLIRHRCDVCGKFTKKEEGDLCEECWPIKAQTITKARC